MVEVSNTWFGWLPQGSLPMIAQKKPELFTLFPFTLITCIDSTRATDGIPLVFDEIIAFAENHKAWYDVTGLGIILMNSFVLELTRPLYNLFNGFDEIWFFADKPAKTLTASEPLTSEIPATEGDQAKWRLEVAEWMLCSKCTLGIGDGIGLNYATLSVHLARQLEQPG